MKDDLILDWILNVEGLKAGEVRLDYEGLKQYGCEKIRVMIYKAD